MKILLVQHGAALSKEESSERPLSDEGRGDVEALAALLSERGVTMERVIHSGKLRAQQTAEILAESFGAQVAEEAGLAPNDAVAPWASYLKAIDQDIVLVGHQPFVGRLATQLLVAREEPSCVQFVPGSVLCLELVEGVWAARWMVAPTLLRRE